MIVPARRGRRGVARGDGDLLRPQQHLGADVFDRLETADRLAELLTYLGVLRSGVQRPSGDSGRLGRQHRRGQVLEPAPRETARRVAGAAVTVTLASGREKSVAARVRR